MASKESRKASGAQLGLHDERVHAAAGLHDDMVMGRDLLDAREHVLDLRGDTLVPRMMSMSSGRAHLVHAGQRAAAGTRARCARRSNRGCGSAAPECPACKGGVSTTPHLALAHRLAGFRIDDLPQEVILGDMLLVALGQTLARGTPGPMTSVRP